MPAWPCAAALTGLTLTATLTGACTGDGPTALAAGERIARVEGANGVARVSLMTRNIYVGTDLDAVVAALVSPGGEDDFPALLTAIETLQRTDFGARAEALAGEIARARPSVVGLQEVSTIDANLTSLGVPIELHLDFLAILQAALVQRGVSYAVAATVRNIDATPAPGIRLQDLDVLLVDPGRVVVGAAQGQLYSTNLGPVAPGVTINRGFVRIDATIDDLPLTIASTHLEPGAASGLDQLRAAQALELAALLASAPRVVVLGDLNDVPGSPMYQALIGAGFTDVWAALRPAAAGYTCCHAPDLSNQTQHFNQRIDYVLVRGLEQESRPVRGRVDRIGDEPAAHVEGPVGRIWPSDHAGLVAELLLIPAAGPAL